MFGDWGRWWRGGGGGVMFDAVVFCALLCITLLMLSPQWGPANAEIQVPSVENSELRNVLPLRLRVGQNIAMHALCTAKNFLLVLALTSPVHSPSFFFANPLPAF